MSVYFILEDNTIQETPPKPYEGERLKAVVMTNTCNPMRHLINGAFTWAGINRDIGFEEIVQSLQSVSSKQMG